MSINPSGRNRRTVWKIATQPYPDAHFATFPEALVEPCVLAGCPEGGLVMDPFAGSGTAGEVCHRLGRRFVGLELSAAYCQLAKKRTAQMGLITSFLDAPRHTASPRNRRAPRAPHDFP